MKNLAIKNWSEIFDVINDSITIHDIDFNIVHANKAAEKMLKLSSLKILNQKCFRSYHGTSSPPKQCPSCMTLHTGEPTTSEIFEPNLNKYIEIKALPLFDEKKKVVGLVHVVKDFTKRKKMENELMAKAKELEESNIALKVLLRQREKDKEDIEDNLLYNIKYLIFPFITKLKGNNLKPKDITYLKIIESNLNEIISPFTRKLASHNGNFTPKEIQVINLIKDGRKDKDIAEILYMSMDTVKTHRKNIRKKLSINHRKINLRNYLLSQ